MFQIRHIFISPDHNFFGHYGQPAGKAPAIEVTEAELVAGKGIVGDRFFGYKENYRGQITFFSSEIFARLQSELEVSSHGPETLRRNVITEGIDLNTLIGQEFTLQGIRFEGVSECSPCDWLDKVFAAGTEAALKGHGGLRARILTSGTLRVSPAPR